MAGAFAGFSSAEAAARLTRQGPNRVQEAKPPSYWALAFSSLFQPFNALMLTVAIITVCPPNNDKRTFSLVMVSFLDLPAVNRQALKAECAPKRDGWVPRPLPRCFAGAVGGSSADEVHRGDQERADDQESGRQGAGDHPSAQGWQDRRGGPLALT